MRNNGGLTAVTVCTFTARGTTLSILSLVALNAAAPTLVRQWDKRVLA